MDSSAWGFQLLSFRPGEQPSDSTQLLSHTRGLETQQDNTQQQQPIRKTDCCTFSPENSSHYSAISCYMKNIMESWQLKSLTFIKWSLTGILDLKGVFRQPCFLEVKYYKLSGNEDTESTGNQQSYLFHSESGADLGSYLFLGQDLSSYEGQAQQQQMQKSGGCSSEQSGGHCTWQSVAE